MTLNKHVSNHRVDFDGTIWLKITDSGVEVVPLTYDQMRDLSKASKEYP